MKKISQTAAIAGAAVAVSLLIFAPTVSAATTTVMISGNTSTGENQPGWLFNRDSVSPYEFNTDESRIGAGSLYVKPITTPAANKFVAENFVNTPVANVDSIAYDFQIGAGGTVADANEFYMNVYANFGVSNDLKFYDCRYDVVATTG